MKSSKINYVVVGSFVLAMIAALIVSVALLTGRTGATDIYYTVYDNVTNLKYGTQVMFEGYPVGQVEDISPLEKGGKVRFRIEMSVRKGWRIPVDSVAQISSSGLLSATTILIRAGDSQTMLKPGAEIPSSNQQNVLEAISSVAGETGGLIQRLRDIADQFADSAPEITQNLSAFSAKLNESGSQLQAFLKKKNAQNLEASLANFSRLSRQLNATGTRLDKLINDSSLLVAENRGDLKQAVRDLQHVMASLARHVDAISHNLEVASRNMSEFSRQIRANPGALLSSKPPADEAEQ